MPSRRRPCGLTAGRFIFAGRGGFDFLSGISKYWYDATTGCRKASDDWWNLKDFPSKI
jgi:hypothetical protein